MATKARKNGPAKPAAPVPAERPTPAPEAVIAAPVQSEEVAETPLTNPADTAPQQPAAAAPVAPEQEAIRSAASDERKLDTMIDTNTAQAQAFFADFNDRTKAAVEKSTKLIEEANEFAKGNVEALVESAKIAAKGFEALGQDASDYGRKSYESATAAFKTFAAVKTPAELFKAQSDFLRGAFDAYVAEASKTTEAVIKLAGDSAQPISSRVALAVEKVKTAA